MPTQHVVRAHIAIGAVVGGCIVVLAIFDGGYFPTTWGLILLAVVLAACITAIVSDTFEAGWRDVAFVAGLAAFALWQLASIVWSDGADAQVLEAERTLIYVTAIATLFFAARRAQVETFVAGLGAGIVLVALVGLVEHLAFSDPSVLAERLAQPIGYANADGLLVGLGLVFALAAASRGRVVVRVAAAAASVPLAAGLYLTLSRGAILATAVGIVCMLAIDPRRIEAAAAALVILVPVTVALALTSHSSVVAGSTSSDDLGNAGRRLLVELALLAVSAGAAALAAMRLRRRRALSARARGRLNVGLGIACAVLLGLAFVMVGGPVRAARDAVDSFAASAPRGASGSSARLVSGSGSYRADYWQVAWSAARNEPLHGAGAGSFERLWLAGRPIDQNVRDAHNLYLEVLAELGAVGLVILCLTLAVPLTAVPRVRAEPFMPAAAGAYITFLAHASLDWDWEVPALTLVALAAGATLIVAARTGSAHALSLRPRVVVLGLLAPLLVLAAAIHGGQGRLEQARRTLDRGNSARAAQQAGSAARWLPWAAEPWQLRGEALLELGDVRGSATALHRASRMNSANWEIWYELALVERGKVRAQALARAKELNPRSREIAALEGP